MNLLPDMPIIVGRKADYQTRLELLGACRRKEGDNLSGNRRTDSPAHFRRDQPITDRNRDGAGRCSGSTNEGSLFSASTEFTTSRSARRCAAIAGSAPS